MFQSDILSHFKGLSEHFRCLLTKTQWFSERRNTHTEHSLEQKITTSAQTKDTIFFGYNKTEFFSFQNSPKNLDPSYNMDLGFLDCLGRVKLVL